MNDGQLPPPFVVGQKYFDRDGEYTVVSTDANQVTIERSMVVEQPRRPG